MSKIGSKKLKASFNGEEVEVTLQQQVMSTALAIQALEKLLIARGIIADGELEKGVAEIVRGMAKAEERLIQLLQ